MLLSGFLMCFQYQLRSTFEDWTTPSVWIGFWVRRLFRLSPLYFLMLIPALALGGRLYDSRMVIDSFLGGGAQLAERYLDDSPTNILMHVTYLYGLFPSYSFRTALPDWSLGLEMQFYAAFPFIVLLTQRFGWSRSCALLALAMVVVALALHKGGVDFPMPSFLPLKLHVFLAGMLAAAPATPNRTAFQARLGVGLVLALLPMAAPLHPGGCLARGVMYLLLVALVHGRSWAWARQAGTVLGSRPFFWIGELSYGVYLAHLMIAQPVIAWIITHYGHTLNAAGRFGLAVPVVLAVSYSLALLTYFLVERPGQHLGKTLIRRRAHAAPDQAGAVVITAP